jgi:DNA-binding transcriptional regulator YhcF (GntR family)
LHVEIDPSSPVPAYEQLRRQIEAMILSGVLPAGTRLPAIRQLANDLGLAANTVARVYRELESAGRVRTGARNGTTVAAQPTRQANAEVRARARHAAREYLASVGALGLSIEDAIAALRSLQPPP